MDCIRMCSIITVSFNSVSTIERTIKSVLNQTYENIEYIIVDGGSSDGTVDIIKKYEPMFKGKMKWISEPDEGIYFAMNKGIDMADGDLIGIINSDDFYEPNAVEIVMDYLGNKDGNIIIYGLMRTLREGIEDTVSMSSPYFIKNHSLAHPSTFVTQKLYKSLGKYDTNFCCASDYDFFLRMTKEHVEFWPVYSILANFNIGGISSTSKAYYDLLSVKLKHGIMSVKDYRKEYFKCKLYDFFH